jgi:hypothetical protein
MTLTALRAALAAGDDGAALAALLALRPSPAEEAEAAAFALHLGQPSLALRWEADALIRAAAQLRLGQSAAALTALEGQPAARPAVLRARAAAQLAQPGATALAALARRLARQEGDAGALVAAAVLIGEGLLRAEPKAALHALAEGLKVAELTDAEADAHLLAVLAHAQAAPGSRDKAGRTAAKALARSLPRSPARVIALLALDREAEAHAEAQAGELGAVWWMPFRPGE